MQSTKINHISMFGKKGGKQIKSKNIVRIIIDEEKLSINNDLQYKSTSNEYSNFVDWGILPSQINRNAIFEIIDCTKGKENEQKEEKSQQQKILGPRKVIKVQIFKNGFILDDNNFLPFSNEESKQLWKNIENGIIPQNFRSQSIDVIFIFDENENDFSN